MNNLRKHLIIQSKIAKMWETPKTQKFFNWTTVNSHSKEDLEETISEKTSLAFQETT